MAHFAPQPARELPRDTDWLAEFPAEDEMDAAWSERPAQADPFDFFAQETTPAEAPSLPLIIERPAAIEPLLAPVPAPRIATPATQPWTPPRERLQWRPKVIAGVLAVPALVMTAVLLAVPREVATPDLPPHWAPEPAAVVPVPAQALTAPPATQPVDPVVVPTETRASVPPAPLPRLTASPVPPPPPLPAKPTPPPAGPQNLPPPPPPALGVFVPVGSAPAGSRGNAVVVTPPPDIPVPPPTTSSRPPAAGTGTAAPATAGATSPPPVDLAAAAAAVDVAEIEGVLGGYRRGFSALDVERVQQVWPGVDSRALERAFRGLERQTFEFESCQIQPKGTDAFATCSGRASFVPKVGGRATQVERREWTFTLSKRAGRWVIENVASKR
jgi:hypothetical protein